MNIQKTLFSIRAWLFALLVGLLSLTGCVADDPPAATDTSTPEPTATWTATPTVTPTLTPTPQTILAATEVPQIQVEMDSSAEKYYVLPVLFVPKDLTPSEYNIAEITRRMERMQRWYAEQMRDVTFTFEPVLTLIGTYEREDYYQPCFPPDTACDWNFELWDSIFRDMAQNLGYAERSDRILAVYFQNDGMGGFAAGGQYYSLNRLGTVVGDCQTPICTNYMLEGRLGHSLGLNFGIWNTKGEEIRRSIMGIGAYHYPHATIMNSATNPEIDRLRKSRFLNQQAILTDGGFEDCLDHWVVDNLQGRCSREVMSQSGEQGVDLKVKEEGFGFLRQDLALEAGVRYDITGWVEAMQGDTTQIFINTYGSDGGQIGTEMIGEYITVHVGWEKVGGIYEAVSDAVRYELVIAGNWRQALLDDFAVTPSYHPPVHPLPLTYYSGDAFANSKIEIRWSDIPNAPVYQLQVDLGGQFLEPVLDMNVSSPFYTIPETLLEAGKTYSWRVRAGNGAGWSEWSPVWQIAVRPAGEYVGEEFDASALDLGWKWADPSQADWGGDGLLTIPGWGFISIAAEEGTLAGSANNVKSILLREAPAGDWTIGTRAELWFYPDLDGQQGGLIIYQDDDNYMTMMYSFNQGYRVEWTVEVDGEIVVHNMDWSEWGIPIRIERKGNNYTAWYSYDGVEWRVMPMSITVDWASPRVGLTAFGSQGDEPVTAYFEYFRFAYPE